MKNYERYTNAKEAEAAFLADNCMHTTWCAFHWLYAEHTGDRLTDLKTLRRAGLGTNKQAAEIKRLEKKLAKEAAK